ncbi:YjgN family protein [Sphingomonas sp. BN140010]|uniref:YjgN family protein n=1 Tax=Sphingomonas arvum TaxID=2992113 RepID=A0ABT3JFH6_9SPHN|nr:YjgN family protein [Sphingomonas sp. BN140010]MCW3797827.1 YjgN family protein [Sphingomonas sp. BN140010]
MDSVRHDGLGGRAIRFTGNWREYLPIAATNVLLVVVTLGVYRFWASARERRYLWSRTHVIDDTLEWTGTGKEMFFGFLMVMAVMLPFFLFIQLVFPALVARGKEGAAAGLATLVYLGIFVLIGFARFRALRYRLSRTWWHGIRGGSDDSGWSYAAEYLGRSLAAFATLFIMFPWAQTSLWNLRWNKMSFGPLPFRADLTTEGLKRRWALLYIAPFAMLIVGGILAAIVGFSLRSSVNGATLGVIFVGLFALVYLAIPLATLHWYAKYYRHAAAATSLGELQFGFDATTWDWLKLFLGNIAWAMVTLGFGISFWGYRNWSFIVRHAHLYGHIDLAELTQSTTRAPRESEGFADAFDLGAI